MVNLEIDGKTVAVENGSTVDAATKRHRCRGKPFPVRPTAAVPWCKWKGTSAAAARAYAPATEA